MLINILGGDGGGKTTQIGLLTPWLAETFGRPVRTMAKKDIFDPVGVPECDFFGVDYKSLAHHYLPHMLAESRALWLIYMNAVLIRRCPPQAGEIVVHDGYWQKHYGTEAAMGLDPDWLLDVCRFFPEPEITLMLDIDPRAIVARGHVHRPYESGCDFGCGDEAFIAHQDKVRAHLLALARQRGYPVIDADRPVDRVLEDLKAEIFARAPREVPVLEPAE